MLGEVETSESGPQAVVEGFPLFRRYRGHSRHRRADLRQAFMNTRPSRLATTPALLRQV